MSTEEKAGLTFLVVKFSLANVGSYLLFNYDKVLGAVFTLLSIIYVSFKIWNEFLKPKPDGKN